MVREAAEAHAMRPMAIVQTRITGLDAVQTAVEGGRLDADFWNQVARKVGLEIRRVRGARIREKVSVEERGYGCLPAHFGCRGRKDGAGAGAGTVEEGGSGRVHAGAMRITKPI